MQVMYKLTPNPKYTFNAAFILEFKQKVLDHVVIDAKGVID
jgi:hypothetical protein